MDQSSHRYMLEVLPLVMVNHCGLVAKILVNLVYKFYRSVFALCIASKKHIFVSLLLQLRNRYNSSFSPSLSFEQ